MRNPYGHTITSEPAAEPVGTTEFRNYARIDDSSRDGVIEDLLITARKSLEIELNRSFIQQTHQVKLDNWQEPILLPYPPLQSVSSITYMDTAGTTQTLGSTTYRVDTTFEPGRITLGYGETWPALYSVSAPITITYVAGYSTSSTGVPETVRTMVRMLAAHWYENPEPINIGNIVNAIPEHIQRLIWNERTGSM